MEDAPDVSLFGSEAGRRALSLANQSREISETRKLMGLMVPPADPQLEQLRLQNAELTRQLAEVRTVTQLDGLKRDFDAKFERIAAGIAAMSSGKSDGQSLENVLLQKLVDKVLVDPLESAVKVTEVLKGLGAASEFDVKAADLRGRFQLAQHRMEQEERREDHRLEQELQQEVRQESTTNRVVDLAAKATDLILKPLGEPLAQAFARKIDASGVSAQPPRLPTDAERQAAIGQLDALIATATVEKQRFLTMTSANPPPIGTGPWPSGNPAPPAVFPGTPAEAAPISQGQLIAYRPPITGKIYGPGGEQT